MLSVKEDALDNRQQHLDVMCFPVVFPTGKFGKFHPRDVKLSHSEYIKSRLLNKDSRFRKDAQCVFYLLWQKEMPELSTGVYITLKSTTSQHMSVSTLLNKVDASDEHLDANLCTLCTPISVSRKFSLKFHAFFCTVILKGEVLGKVDHFYWKKEYQAREVPHCCCG